MRSVHIAHDVVDKCVARACGAAVSRGPTGSVRGASSSGCPPRTRMARSRAAAAHQRALLDPRILLRLGRPPLSVSAAAVLQRVPRRDHDVLLFQHLLSMQRALPILNASTSMAMPRERRDATSCLVRVVCG